MTGSFSLNFFLFAYPSYPTLRKENGTGKQLLIVGNQKVKIDGKLYRSVFSLNTFFYKNVPVTIRNQTVNKETVYYNNYNRP